MQNGLVFILKYNIEGVQRFSSMMKPLVPIQSREGGFGGRSRFKTENKIFALPMPPQFIHLVSFCKTQIICFLVLIIM